MRSDNEEMQKQYQQYHINMQQHCQELNNQVQDHYQSFIFQLYLS
jgi:hypothetical protein